MKNKNEKLLMRILILTLIIIIVGSIEALILGKSKDFYEAFIDLNKDLTLNDYISFVLMKFFFNIFIPLVVSIYYYLTRNSKTSNMAKVILGGLILIGIVNIFFTLNYKSIFYYLMLILYFLLFITVLSYEK